MFYIKLGIKNDKIKNRQFKKGFTLVELIIVIAIMGLIISISSNMITIAMKGHKQTVETYTLQSALRMATDKVTNTVRYSKAVFAVPDSFVTSVNKMDTAWYYLSVSPDKKKIVEYYYDSTQNRFIENTIVDEQEGIYYEMHFKKDTDNPTDSNNRLLEYTIAAYYGEVDGSGNIVSKGEKISFSSETEALNSNQIVDKGTYFDESVAIAYRFDDPFTNEFSHVGTVSLVLDTSGSMSTNLGGKSRIERLEDALMGGGTDEGLIDILAKETNIEVVMVPFDSDANKTSFGSGANQAYSNVFYNADSEKSKLESISEGLYANGGTNTGDGLRRAYYNHYNFIPSSKGYPDGTLKVNYMIILVDGDTTYETKVEDRTSYYVDDGDYDSDIMDRVGTGSDSMSNGPGSYVYRIGELIKASSPGIKTYVIGFDSSISTSVIQIADSIGTNKSEDLHLYNSSTFDLSEIFSDIANDIVADMWLIMGPQIQN